MLSTNNFVKKSASDLINFLKKEYHLPDKMNSRRLPLTALLVTAFAAR